MNEKVFILFGAPGSGKSESCKILTRLKGGMLRVVMKETTRAKRASDGQEIKSVRKISASCDIRYSQYNCEYGFSTRYIWECLRSGYSVAVIVNDIRTIRILDRKFGILAHNIYIHSNIDRRKIRELSKARYPNKSDTFLRSDVERRAEKIKTIHRKYIENTYLFNSAVINEYDLGEENSRRELIVQLKNVCHASPFAGRRRGSSARVIIIAGGSFTGKDGLVNAMIQIEPNKVVAYRKGTTRPKKKGDRNELRHLQMLGDEYDIVYEKNGYKYGLAVAEIWDRLSEEKIVLIVLSDQKAIIKMKERFGEICTTIYLHGNIDPKELKLDQHRLSREEFVKRRKSVIELRSVYIENMNMFDHVLLNTSEPEDLYDQAFNILDYYLD